MWTASTTADQLPQITCDEKSWAPTTRLVGHQRGPVSVFLASAVRGSRDRAGGCERLARSRVAGPRLRRGPRSGGGGVVASRTNPVGGL